MSYGSRKRGYDQGGCVRGGLTSLHLRRITSSPSQTIRRRLVRTTDDGRRGVLDARCRLSRLYFSHFATRTVDNTVDLYAAKPDIRPESRFLPTPPAFDAIARGVPVGISPSRLARKTRMAWLHDGEKILKICLFVFIWYTNVTDRQTDTACRHRPRLCKKQRETTCFPR